MRHAFRLVNVFAVPGDRLSGNPLCVFPDARGLSDAQMQALARQLNLSETTFVLPSTRATARVRIFTPSYEMPFAGHPTLGTAHVVGGERVVLEMIAGLVTVERAGDTWTLRPARPPATRPVAVSQADLARMLGLPADAVGGEPRWVDTGTEQLVIPLSSPAHVRAARPVPALLAEHGYTPARQEAMAYVWARDTGGDVVARFFFTQHGAVIEDPATGSACANLGGWLVATGAPLPQAMTVHQGDAIARPSRLGLAVDADRTIRVSGLVVDLGGGELEL